MNGALTTERIRDGRRWPIREGLRARGGARRGDCARHSLRAGLVTQAYRQKIPEAQIIGDDPHTSTGCSRGTVARVKDGDHLARRGGKSPTLLRPATASRATFGCALPSGSRCAARSAELPTCRENTGSVPAGGVLL